MLAKICISGLSAVGKTYVAKILAKKIDAKRISVSTLLLDAGILLGYDSFKPEERVNHFWFSEKAKIFNNQRLENVGLDRKIDSLVVDYIQKKKRIVVDSLSTPALVSQKGSTLKILFKADLSVRTARAWLSSPIFSREEIRKGLNQKDEATRDILLAAWGIDIFSEKYEKLFDVVINNSSFDNPNDIKSTEFKSKKKNFEIVFSIVQLYQDAIADREISEKSKSIILKNLLEYPKTVLRLSANLKDFLELEAQNE